MRNRPRQGVCNLLHLRPATTGYLTNLTTGYFHLDPKMDKRCGQSVKRVTFSLLIMRCNQKTISCRVVRVEISAQNGCHPQRYSTAGIGWDGFDVVATAARQRMQIPVDW